MSGKCQPFCLGLNMLKISADNQSPSESQWLSWLPVWQAEGHWRMCLADHWFRQWLVACFSAPGHYLNQCFIYVNKALGNKLKLKFNQNAMFLSRKCISKFCLQNVGHFISFPVFTYSFPVFTCSFPLPISLINDKPLHPTQLQRLGVLQMVQQSPRGRH